jgi:cytochrome c oxidase subunit 2
MKADVVPGIPNRTQWTPNELTMPQDTFQVVCAELCGSGHNGMRSDVCVVEADLFAWWQKNSDVTCPTLRLMNCEAETAAANAGELRGRIDKLLADDPEADCDDLEEAA